MPSPVLPDPSPEDARTIPSGPDEAFAPPLLVQRTSPVNWFLIAGSVALFVWSNLGQDQERLYPWFISLADARLAPLVEVRHGQVWRLVTPAFIHFSLMHIGFNMLNLVGLGNILERRLNSWNYGVLVLGLAVTSNLAQYFIYGSPAFGGMSGVVYGLIGYIWLRGRYDRTFGLAIPQQMVIIALVWFVACFTGALGPIANAAHGAGLVLGGLWGLADSRRAMVQARERRF